MKTSISIYLRCCKSFILISGSPSSGLHVYRYEDNNTYIIVNYGSFWDFDIK